MSAIEQFGKYILMEKLASGGMAEVYLSKSTGAVGVNKFVAIKRILPQYSDNPEFVEMFKEEAKIAVHLNQGNVVSIYDFGVENGQFFLVMEYVEGRNLRQILNEFKRQHIHFSVDQIAFIVKEVAAGLDHAHRCIDGTTGKPLNITHRDMSPQNIMISFEGEVKIIDFGIAKAETQIEATKAGTLKGKFGYMSPEQADGQSVDLRTDIFSLGIVLWELLANDRLFTANSEAAILRKIRDCQIPPLRKINPSIPAELEKIVNKALSKDKNLRYQTAAALYRDLNRFLNTEYPEFSSHDFSLFMKNTFSHSFLEQRKRLVEYAQAPAPEPIEKTVLNNVAKMTLENKEALEAMNAQEAEESSEDHLNIDTATNIKVNLDSIHKQKSHKTNTPSHTRLTRSKIKKENVKNIKHSTQSNFFLFLSFFVIATVLSYFLYNDSSKRTWVSHFVNSYFASDSKTKPSPREQAPAQVEPVTEEVTMGSNTKSYALYIESEPSSAKIYVNGEDSGNYTPFRMDVKPNQLIEISLSKEGYLTYQKELTPTEDASSIRATLQPLRNAGFVSISLINGGSSPIIFINGRKLLEKLPIELYPVPANVPVRIKVHNPYSGMSAEKTIVVGTEQKLSVELILGISTKTPTNQ